MKATPRHFGRDRGPRGGFTLAELLVVMGVIVMLLVLALPNIRVLLTSGSIEQAKAVMGGCLGATRAIALERQTFALLHVQPRMADRVKKITDEFWMVTMVLDSQTVEFNTVEGYRPTRLPRDVGAGEVNSDFMDATGGTYDNTKLDDYLEWQDFTAFNVIYGPDGALVVNGQVPSLRVTAPVFGTQSLWLPVPEDVYNETGTRAITFFDYKKLNIISGSARAAALNESGQFMVINPYTGRLVDAE